MRDVAAGSQWAAGEAAEAALDLKLTRRDDGAASHCVVADTSGADRAVTLAYCVPLDAACGTWWDDPQRFRAIDAAEMYANLSENAGGVGNSASLYPLAVVAATEATATVLAAPPDRPRMVRFVYDAPRRELRAEFDFGLTVAATEHFPSRADASVVRFDVPARWAFRRALERYYELFPRAFQRRAKHGGTWLPFGETGAIENAADFGFAFHEIADHQSTQQRILDDDARLGCGSYTYVEPQSHWQHFAGAGAGTYDERLAQLEREAAAGSSAARATLTSGAIRHDGRRDLYLDDVAYTPMRPWGCDANPHIAGGKGAYEIERVEKLLGWGEAARAALNEGDAGVPPTEAVTSAAARGVDGVYVDSMEGWGEILNYNRDHWRVATHPLTFDPSTKRVALLNFWGTVEWVKRMSERSRESDALIMGNDAFFRRWQMAAYVDVPGREYTWIDDAGKVTPVSDERYLFLRAMSARRPYLMLMNNAYDDASVMEPYFQRSLFYAVFPSFFIGHQSMNEVAYFSNPAWYNRDRGLFKKYLPLIRAVDEAGWEPVPHATASPAEVRVERYGSGERGKLFFTVHNPGAAEIEATLTLDRAALKIGGGGGGGGGDLVAREMIRGDALTTNDGDDDAPRVRLRLAAGGYAMVSLAPRSPQNLDASPAAPGRGPHHRRCMRAAL